MYKSLNKGFSYVPQFFYLSFQTHEHPLIDLPKSITNLSVCSLPFCCKILRSNMAARASTRTTVARGSATSTAACSRRQTTPTRIRPTKSVFTSWKVQQPWSADQLDALSACWKPCFVLLKPYPVLLLLSFWAAAAWHLLSRDRPPHKKQTSALWGSSLWLVAKSDPCFFHL